MAPLARRRVALSVDYFSIQCGVYSRTENADSQAADLTRRGMPATVRREVRDGQSVFVVLTGRFSSYADALRALAGVRKTVPDAVIWP
jgi:cell division protein FtsN